MTTADAFLADIIAHPKDDTPRLIYADWLDDHGQPERGEFIRRQISGLFADWVLYSSGRLRFRLSPDDLPDDGVELFRVPEWCESLAIRRGFVAKITCKMDDWMQHGPAIVRQQPIELLTITDREPALFSYGEEYYWYPNTSYDDTPYDDTSHHHVPEVLRDYLDRLGAHYRGGFATYFHGNRQFAIDRLGQACLLWTRDAAHLIHSEESDHVHGKN